MTEMTRVPWTTKIQGAVLNRGQYGFKEGAVLRKGQY